MDEIFDTLKKVFDKSLRAIGIAYVHLDEEGNPVDATIEYANDAMAATAFTRPEELQGKKIYEIWPDGDRAWLDYMYLGAYHDESIEFETVSVAYKTFQNVTLFPIVKGYVGYEIEDITKWLKQAHLSLESVSAGLFFYESRTELLMLTESAMECCGLTEGYMSVRDFANMLFPPERAEIIYETIVGLSPEYDRIVCEERMICGNWIRLSMSSNESNRFSVGFLEDITTLREAEAASSKRSGLIETLSSEYFALYMLDLEADMLTPYLLRNEVAQHFAKDIGEGIQYTKWLEHYVDSYVNQDDRERVRERLSIDHLVSLDESDFDDYSVNCKRLFFDEEQYIELKLVKVPGEYKTLLLAARNVNDEVREQLDQKIAIQNALTIAQHANQAKTTFLTNISHDFRTPLNSIMGFSDLALENLDDPKKVKICLDRIIVSGEHLIDLINDVLDVSRIESGKLKFDEQSMNFAELIDDVSDLFAPQAGEKGVELTFDRSKIKHPDIVSDRMRLYQILVNTVGNAIKYTDDGGRVEVSFSETGVSPSGVAMFEIKVKDNGCGISEDFIDKIFVPFERENVNFAQSREGTGLGMTITKNLIDFIGGSIKVNSAVGVGTELEITLPLKLDEQHRNKIREDTRSKQLSDERFDGMRVLAVDDDELSREMMVAILGSRGFEVEEARNGQEAFDMVKESKVGHFDAIIMDMRMPGLSGDEATRKIRALGRKDMEIIPIIAATADAFAEGYHRAKEAGMTAHITKPINRKKLIELLSSLLK